MLISLKCVKVLEHDTSSEVFVEHEGPHEALCHEIGRYKQTRKHGLQIKIMALSQVGKKRKSAAYDSEN